LTYIERDIVLKWFICSSVTSVLLGCFRTVRTPPLWCLIAHILAGLSPTRYL